MKSELEALLKHPLRVQVKDGRVLIGCFYGTDKLLNVSLVDAKEYHSEQRQPRSVGRIMIPWKIVVKVEAEEDEAATAFK